MLSVREDTSEGLEGAAVPLTHEFYRVETADGECILRLGVSKVGLMTKSLYIWALPQEGLKVQHLRPLKRLFSEYDFHGYAAIASSAVRAAKFAAFFGFQPTGAVSDGFDIYEV